MKILVADIGGTHSRLLLAEVENNTRHIISESTYLSRDFSDFIAILKLFLCERKISAACIAVAGPVRNGVAEITNLPWLIREDELVQLLETSNVKLINDFVAVAYGVTELNDKDILLLHKGEESKIGAADSSITVVGAGTGLGAANQVLLDGHYFTLTSEVGHIGFAPDNKTQTKLLAWLQELHQHVSLEMILSGRGLVRLYHFFNEVIGLPQSSEVKEAMLHNDPAKIISDYALANKDNLCVKTLDCFVEIYGSAAGDIALHYFSSTELYIAGGIAEKIKNKMSEKRFLNAFFNKGLMSEKMKKITVKLVLENKVGLYGALSYAKENI